MSTFKSSETRFASAVFVFMGVLLWEMVVYSLGTYRLPHLAALSFEIISSFKTSAIIEAQGGGSEGFAPHIVSTFGMFLPSLLLGAFIGIVLALILQISLWSRYIGVALLEFFRVLPPLIFIPFFLLLVGASYLSVFLVGAIYASYMSCVYALGGIQHLKPTFASLSKLYGATRLQICSKVLLPGLLPEFVGGLRITSGLTLGVVVVAEYLGAPSGLGRTLKYAMSYNSVQLILVGVFWAILLGLVVDWLIVQSFKKLLIWSTRMEVENRL